MAKGQVRGNKEARKPKAKKEAVATPIGLPKTTLSAPLPRKKKG
jgi:hypothetical protein